MTTKPTFSTWKAVLLTGLAATVAATGPVDAQTQLKQVKMVGGSGNLLNLAVFYLLLPGPLGYWKEEGYQVDIAPVSGSTEAIQQLSIGNIDFAQLNASAIIQANTDHNLPVRAVITNSGIGWGVAVKKGGAIKSVTDLKGKTIGIVSLSSGGIALFNSYLKKNGLDPQTDVTLVATGMGAPAVHALESDRVQGLMYWASALAGFENAGAEINILRDPAWAKLPDYTFSTSQTVIDKDPRMVEGIARGVAKAMVFAAANPDCARRIVWQSYPDSKPTGVTEDVAAANDLSLINAVLGEQKLAENLNRQGYVAAASAEAFGAYQDFLVEAGVINGNVDPTKLVADIDGLWDKINSFDKSFIEEQAKACKL